MILPQFSRLCRVTILVLGLLGTVRAHDPFQTTVVSRLQHGRLEVAVTMTTLLGDLLVRDPADLEAPELNAGTFEQYRERLQQRALTLYDVIDGSTVLTPQRTVVKLTANGHVEFTLIYPPPATWPLRMRARSLEKVPPGYTAEVEVIDQEDHVLGRKIMNPREPGGSELSVQSSTSGSPALIPNGTFAPAVPAPVARTAASARWPWSEIGIAILFGASAVVLATRFFRKSPSINL